MLSLPKRTKTNRPASPTTVNLVIVITISISALAWIIAFVGSIAASQSIEHFPKFTWWGLVFQLFVVIIIPVAYYLGLLPVYRNFLMASVIIAFIYSSNSTNNMIYYSSSSTSAASTGFILLSMTNFLWLVYLGSDESSPIVEFIDQYGKPINIIERKRLSISTQNRHNSNNYKSSGSNVVYQSTAYLNHNQSDIYSNMEDSHELAGFENPVSESLETPQLSEFNDSAFRQSGILPVIQIDPNNNGTGTNLTGISSVSKYMESYPILVRGLYDYNASPDDVNELSFKKGEIFRVKNTNGNWWQAKNKKGEIGMCPSNYLEIVT
ncbi:hypothetical protein CAS74_003128 [Pichia kudriavzevii]|uniref:High osmolarity signaling protein SHO1 n=1 Tax=Pichia kudriavzevii TaxID=4909 RepID=A0A1V2LV41_PICKU|nr:High osmolarity signaling protein SHO1 [Pichia kudriavzevii]OUT22138.1 hypothetical protein CAS74_003128 [Pichia kudriavzevii]